MLVLGLNDGIDNAEKSPISARELRRLAIPLAKSGKQAWMRAVDLADEALDALGKRR